MDADIGAGTDSGLDRCVIIDSDTGSITDARSDFGAAGTDANIGAGTKTGFDVCAGMDADIGAGIDSGLDVGDSGFGSIKCSWSGFGAAGTDANIAAGTESGSDVRVGTDAVIDADTCVGAIGHSGFDLDIDDKVTGNL